MFILFDWTDGIIVLDGKPFATARRYRKCSIDLKVEKKDHPKSPVTKEKK